MATPDKPSEGVQGAADGMSAADFLADPNKAIGKLRAEIKKEIIESNLMFAIALYALIRWERKSGPLF